MSTGEPTRRYLPLGLAIFLGIGLASALLLALEARASVQPPGPSLSAIIAYPPGIGTWPAAVAAGGSSGYVYVASQESSEISVISRTRVITTFTVPGAPGPVHVNPTNGYAYVTCIYWPTVHVISGTTLATSITLPKCDGKIFAWAVDTDPHTGYTYLAVSDPLHEVLILDRTEIVQRLAVGRFPHDVAANPATGRVYVSHAEACRLTVIRGTGVEAEITLPSAPGAIAADPATGRVYVALPGADEVAIISGTQVLATLPTGDEPRDIAVNPRTGYTYVANGTGSNVTVIAGTQVAATLPAGPWPVRVAVNQETGYVYVLSRGPSSATCSLTVISGTQVLASVPLRDEARDIAIDPSSGLAYLPNGRSDNVTVVEGLAPIATLRAGTFPWCIERHPTSGCLYVADPTGDRVSVISGTRLVASLDVGAAPRAIAANPADGLVYVANRDGNSVTVIDGVRVAATVPNVPAPSAVAINPATGYVYVCNFLDGAVTVLRGTDVVSRLAVVQEPAQVRVNPVTGLAYVIGWSRAVSVISDTQVIASPTMKGRARCVTFDLATGLAYVADGEGVAVLDRGEITAYLALRGRPEARFETVEYSAASGYAYAADDLGGRVVVISGTRVVAVLSTEGSPTRLKADPRSGRVYVTHLKKRTLTVISGAQVINKIELPSPPVMSDASVAVDPASGAVYVCHYDHRISVLELQPGFNLAPAVAPWYIRSGSVATRAIELVSQLGFSQPVTLGITGWPAGASAVIGPNPAPPTGTATVTITVASGAPFGPHTLTLTGTAGRLARSVQFPFFAYDGQAFLPLAARTHPATPTPVPAVWPTPSPWPTKTFSGAETSAPGPPD